MSRTNFWKLFLRKALVVAFIGAAVLFGVACGGGQEAPPAPTTPATPTPVDHVAAGRQLYIAKGCAACHGQDAEGTDIAPALPGHNEEQVMRQVRRPMGSMPSSSPEQVSDDELEMIADYFASLTQLVEHREPVVMEDALVMHHWMALYALASDNEAEAEHHIRHILELVKDPEHKAQMEEVRGHLRAGDHHEVNHAIEEMLAGKADTGLSLKTLHLQLAQAAVTVRDAEGAKHHIEHFVDLATGDEKARGEEVIDLLEQDNIHDAEHELEELLH